MNLHHLHPTNPIGIFDSGIGGLTLTQSIIDTLPCENIIYFGDTDHFPYGEKSDNQIQNYANDIADFLLQQHCKMMVIACHSASSCTVPTLQKKLRDRALLVDVITPTIQYIQKHYHPGQTIGLIGTQRTIDSKVYEQAFRGIITLQSQATPSLASAIENSPSPHTNVDPLLQQYLSSRKLQNIDALILGCTHYPLIQDRIAACFDHTIDIINGAQHTAQHIQKLLIQHRLLAPTQEATRKFYVSKYSENFQQKTALFFNANSG